jgi:hypothetical protein
MAEEMPTLVPAVVGIERGCSGEERVMTGGANGDNIGKSPGMSTVRQCVEEAMAMIVGCGI